MFTNKIKWAVFVILILAFLVRFYKIESVPAGLYYDEVDYGYQARSLLQTGKDYRGTFSLFYVHSFNDIRAPIPAYLTAISTLLLKSPEMAVRLPSVIFGTLVVLLIFLIIKYITKSTLSAILTSLVFTVNPWQVQFSRFSHEVIFALFFYLLGFYFFLKALSRKKFKNLIFATLFFSLSVYCYRTMSFFVPLTLIALFVIYKKELLVFGVKKMLMCVVVAGVIIVPFLFATTFGAPDTPRIKQLAIFSDAEVPIWVQRNREVDSGDLDHPEIGKSASKLSLLFHNKPLSYFGSFANNYFYSFGSDFLFTKGDKNPRHSVGQMGELFFIDILGLVFGLFFVVRNLKIAHFKWLLTWFLISPIPAALTMDGAGHAARLFIFSAPLLIIVGLGWWSLFNILKNLKFKKLTLSLIIFFFILSVIFYLHRYFVHFPIESARNFGYGFKEAMLKITKTHKDFKEIKMVTTNDPPMIYYLFWSNTPPIVLQNHGSNFSKERKLNSPLGKFEVIQWPKNGEFKKDTLYLLTQNELDKDLRKETPTAGVKLIDITKYPDNEVAFYLLTGEK